jgi:lysophospholipase L1-like esterase
LLGDKYWVKNFGVSARTMLNKGDRPYMKEQAYQQALAFNPNIVVIKLGTNDSKSFNWVHKADFIKDTQTMIDAFKALPSQPEIYLCYPSKAYLTGESINDDIISKEIIPMIKKVAKKNKLPVIDLHSAMDGMPELFPDHIHPNEEGAKVMAKAVYDAIAK